MSHTLLTRTKCGIRRAVTLVEVIFAIGVVLIGLVGLMSILPLAGRRADDALSLNASAQLAETAMDELMVKKFLSNGRLRTFNYRTPTPSISSADSFVIDPMFCSIFEATEGNVTDSNPAVIAGIGYDQKLFPYYKERHNPYLDPSINSVNWPADQPRMHRVGIGHPTNVNSSTGPAFIDREQALSLVEDSNDLVVSRNKKDRTLPATFQALQSSDSGLEYGKRVPAGTYSWIATVNPLGGGYASVSVVVIRNRERNFKVPTTAVANALESPDQNMVGERLAYVTYSSGFSGGAGGVVHIEGSMATVSRLRSNDWIMLSRKTTNNTIHRWFRIVGVDGKPVEDTAAGTWKHKVLLDGPDWRFGSTQADGTYATLVDGVVSVTERSVLMSDL